MVDQCFTTQIAGTTFSINFFEKFPNAGYWRGHYNWHSRKMQKRHYEVEYSLRMDIV
jgi:hypothetical protein